MEQFLPVSSSVSLPAVSYRFRDQDQNETVVYHQIKNIYKDRILKEDNRFEKRKDLCIETSGIKDINIRFVRKLGAKDPLLLKAMSHCIDVFASENKNRILTNKELKLISKEYVLLRDNLLLGLKERERELIEEKKEYDITLHTLTTTNNKECFYKACAAAAYYSQFSKRRVISTRSGDYKIGEIITNRRGLRAIYFEPIKKNGDPDKNRTPILSFRGTVTSEIGNLKDDLHENIGTLAFEGSKKEIGLLLQISKKKFGQPATLVAIVLGVQLPNKLLLNLPEKISLKKHFIIILETAVGDDKLTQSFEP